MCKQCFCIRKNKIIFIVFSLLSITIFLSGIIILIFCFVNCENANLLLSSSVALIGSGVSLFGIVISTRESIKANEEKMNELKNDKIHRSNITRNSLRIVKLLINKSLVPSEGHKTHMLPNLRYDKKLPMFYYQK